MSWLLDLVLNWLLQKILAIVGGFAALMKTRAQIDADAKASVEPLKKAETEQEIDDASKDALDGF